MSTIEEGRLCNRCREYKEWESFSLNSKGLNGRKSICKDCSNKAQKELNKKRKRKNPAKWSLDRREKALRSKYGLSLGDYETMLKEQDYSCKICGKKESSIEGSLYVDHCHSENKVRGLLCSHCNTGLGMFRDCTYTLSKAILYLEENEPW